MNIPMFLLGFIPMFLLLISLNYLYKIYEKKQRIARDLLIKQIFYLKALEKWVDKETGISDWNRCELLIIDTELFLEKGI